LASELIARDRIEHPAWRDNETRHKPNRLFNRRRGWRLPKECRLSWLVFEYDKLIDRNPGCEKSEEQSTEGSNEGQGPPRAELLR
jgi:hypothetical protein